MSPLFPKVRILNVILEDRFGGPHQRILGVAKKLKDRGMETIVLVSEGDATFPDLLKKNNIKTISLPLKRIRKTLNPLSHLVFLFYFFPNLLSLIKIIEQEDPHIIHANGMGQILGPIAAKITRRKLVWHLNDINTPSVLRVIFRKIFLPWADYVFYASDAVKAQLRGNRNNVPFALMYAPVNTEIFSPNKDWRRKRTLVKELGLSKTNEIIGMIGHINYAKGVMDFVKAASIMLRKNRNLRFIIVGARLKTKQKLVKELLDYIDNNNLEKKIILTGRRHDIKDFLTLFDVFVIPSLYEACPISLLEAMSMEKAIVGTNVGGIPELVRDGKEGLLVPPNDPYALSEKIRFYLDNPGKSKQMGAAARERAVRFFDLEKCVEEHEKYYKELLRNYSSVD